MDDVTLAHAAFDAAEAGDQGRFLACFAPDAVVWQNFDQAEHGIGETAAALFGMRQQLASLRYVERRYIPAPEGAVLQHVSRATLPDGRTLDIPMMMRLYSREGRIRRLEEYFDTRAAGALGAG